MRIIIILYYLFYILSGGFRHFGVDFVFWNNVGGNAISEVPFVLKLMELSLIVYSFCIVLFLRSKYHHLIVGIILLSLDLFFQNKVSFITSMILPHLFPFFIFLYLKYEGQIEKQKLLGYAGMLLVSVGYLTGFYAKFHSNWGNWNDLVLRSYIFEFNRAYQIPTLLGNWMLTIENHLFWESLDWFVLIFQASFVLVFLQKATFHALSILSVLFHVGVILTLGLGVFYPYILFYVFIYCCSFESTHIKKWSNNRSLKRLIYALFGFLLILFIYYGFDPHFFNRMIPTNIYKSVDYLYNLICIFIFAVTYSEGMNIPKLYKSKNSVV